MQGDDPPYLPVGTAVSAKYKGAFCEAKVSKVVRCVKCKITYKMGLGTATVTDEQIRGPLRVGHTVQARHSEKKEFIEATITKIQDCSQYTVVFDDGDITTLRRTALCLKSGRHFNESETLDQLPLTHPEHFGNPVVGGRRGRRSRQLKEDSSDGEVEEETEPDLDMYSGDIGKVVCVEGNDKKKSRDNWFPGLVVVPSAQPTVRINVREEYLVRSFKDGRYYTVPKKEISEFSRDMGARIETTALSEAMEKAIRYIDREELPVHWERATLFDLQMPDSDSEENYTDSSDDEPREEKDHFVAQLYKFMDDRGTPLNKSPMIGSRDVDLYRLFRVVHKLGGYNRVTNQSKWRTVTVRLGYPHNHVTYNSVKLAYKRYLFSFEEFYRKLGCTMINHPRNAKKHRGRSLIRDRDRATPVNNSSPRPEQQRSDESHIVETAPLEKKEEPPVAVAAVAEKVTTPVVEIKAKAKPETSTSSSKVMKTNEKDVVLAVVVVEEKLKKKEVVIESSSDTSSNSSDGTIDVQSDSGRQSSLAKTKDEPKKEKKTDVKLIKERKVKAAVGEKVKAIVEQFEEQVKKEKEIKQQQEDEKAQQTRSKSQVSKTKEVSSPDRKDAPGRSSTKPPKKEEDKKRGRKRKDTETETKTPPTETAAAVEPPTIATQPVNIGDKLKVYYGPTHESKVTYEAKVLEVDRDATGSIYLVHYTGWNTRYDEWIKPGRIAENLSLTTKAKRLKQSQQSPIKTAGTTAAGTGTKPTAAKRGRGTSVSSRTQEPPPRSTTPSSVTSSSSRTKSPATPASKTRITRQATENTTGRRTRRASIHTDLSLASDSESEQSDQSDIELSRTRSGSKTDELPPRRKTLTKRKDDEDTEKEEDSDPKPKRTKRIRKTITSDAKTSTESDDDSSSPPKGRDFDLNQIRSELKGFEKAVKLTSTETVPENPPDEKPTSAEIKPTTTVEKKIEEKTKVDKQVLSTDDIYEFKEPEPFEFEARASKLSEDKSTKKRLVPRILDELEKIEKSPKKKGGKSPPTKAEPKEKDEEKKRIFKRTPVKKIEEVEEEEKSPPPPPPPKEEVTPVKNQPTSSTCEDPFDKLVESPSFNIKLDKKSQSADVIKPKAVKSLNLNEPLSLFTELPETVGDDDSRDHLDLSDTDDTPLFTHKEPIFSDAAFSKPDSSSLDPIFRGFMASVSASGDESKKRSVKDGASDEDDSINAAIQRAISNTMTDEDSTEDDLFIAQSPTIYHQSKLKVKDDLKPVIISPEQHVQIKQDASSSSSDDVKGPLSINTDITKDMKDIKDTQKTPKQISPALQETDSSLLEAISLQTEMLKKEETREPQIKTGTKIADSILQKFNMIKKNEEVKVEPSPPPPPPVKLDKQEEIKKDVVKLEHEVKETPPPEPAPKIVEASESDFQVEIKKRPTKKVVSREFIEESDTDSSDSEERLVIARSDDDSQTNPSDKLDFKDTDSNVSAIQPNTDDSQEERNFKFQETQKTAEPILPDSTTIDTTVASKPDVQETVKQDEEPDSNISLLLCKETIPGSPAPVPDVSPAPVEPRTKPKSAKSLMQEMPFASAPGSSNSKGILTTTVEHVQPPKQSPAKQDENQPLAVPLESTCDNNQPNTVLDNTPPTTPESTISNLSPRADQDRISPNTADNESCKSTDSGQRAQTSKVTHYSEEDTILTSETCPAPKKLVREESGAGGAAAAPCRKRRRSCKASDDIPVVVKRGRRPNPRNVRTNSDSDDTSEHSAPGSTPPTTATAASNHQITTAIIVETTRISSRSPRPSKYNFIIELDPSLDCGQRISLLQQKLSELRKTYNNVKTELACIDRRRKKLRRREREAMKAAKQELTCS